MQNLKYKLLNYHPPPKKKTKGMYAKQNSLSDKN